MLVSIDRLGIQHFEITFAPMLQTEKLLTIPLGNK